MRNASQPGGRRNRSETFVAQHSHLDALAVLGPENERHHSRIQEIGGFEFLFRFVQDSTLRQIDVLQILPERLEILRRDGQQDLVAYWFAFEVSAFARLQSLGSHSNHLSFAQCFPPCAPEPSVQCPMGCFSERPWTCKHLRSACPMILYSPTAFSRSLRGNVYMPRSVGHQTSAKKSRSMKCMPPRFTRALHPARRSNLVLRRAFG